MTYTVFTQRKTNSGYITSIKRKSVSKVEALEIKEKAMANPNRTCNYIIVADSRQEEYLADIDKKNARIKAIKDERWAIVAEMKKKGYQPRDIIDFLNKGLDK